MVAIGQAQTAARNALASIQSLILSLEHETELNENERSLTNKILETQRQEIEALKSQNQELVKENERLEARIQLLYRNQGNVIKRVVKPRILAEVLEPDKDNVIMLHDDGSSESGKEKEERNVDDNKKLGNETTTRSTPSTSQRKRQLEIDNNVKANDTHGLPLPQIQIQPEYCTESGVNNKSPSSFKRPRILSTEKLCCTSPPTTTTTTTKLPSSVQQRESHRSHDDIFESQAFGMNLLPSIPSAALDHHPSTSTSTTTATAVHVKKPAISASKQGGGGAIQPLPPPPPPQHRSVQVIRRRDERMALPGYECQHCGPFYEAIGDLVNRERCVQACSRHRHAHKPYETPEGYWDLSFADSHRAEDSN